MNILQILTKRLDVTKQANRRKTDAKFCVGFYVKWKIKMSVLWKIKNMTMILKLQLSCHWM